MCIRDRSTARCGSVILNEFRHLRSFVKNSREIRRKGLHLHPDFGILNILLEGVVCVGKPACQINTMAVRRLVWLNEQDSSIGFNAVSYTHLDVYKRQSQGRQEMQMKSGLKF